MMMNNKEIIFAIIENLNLERHTTFKLYDWTITNDSALILEHIPNLKAIVTLSGEILGSFLLTKTIAFQIYDVNDLTNISRLIHEESTKLNFLLSLIWFNTDNSFFSSLQISQNYKNHSVIINRRDSFVSNASGNYNVMTISDNLIYHIKEIDFLDFYILLLTKERLSTGDKTYRDISSSYMHRAEIEETMIKQTRIQRSFNILTIARITSFLPMKIAFYINVLECILLNDNAELNFKLQLYTAIFIGENSEEKAYIRNIINTTYDIRSKFFHGSNIKQSVQELRKLSIQLDDIVRKIFLKAIKNHEIFNNKDTSVLNDYLKSIMFS